MAADAEEEGEEEGGPEEKPATAAGAAPSSTAAKKKKVGGSWLGCCDRGTYHGSAVLVCFARGRVILSWTALSDSSLDSLLNAFVDSCTWA